MYTCGAFRSNEEGPSCSLLDISHTPPPILGKLKITWIALDNTFWLRSFTRRRSNCSACSCGVSEGTSAGQYVKNIATATRVEYARKKTEYLIAWVTGLVGLGLVKLFIFWIRGDEIYRRYEYNIFHERQLWVRPIEWLELNFCKLLDNQTRSLGVLILYL